MMMVVNMWDWREEDRLRGKLTSFEDGLEIVGGGGSRMDPKVILIANIHCA